jgi:hypothetical protein
VRSLQEAAQEAVRAAGTEVSAVRVDGHESGPAGRWAQLRRHPWFGEQRLWFGHRPATATHAAVAAAAGEPQAAVTPVPSGRSAAGAVGWTPEDHQAAID